MKSLPRGPAGPGEVWPEASTDAPRPRKSSNKLFQGFRRLGKAQTSCFKVSEASERLKQVVSRFPTRRKGSNKLFQGIRGLGKAQTSCFKESEASERPKQVVSRFPTPRGVCGRPLPGHGSWPDTRRDPNARTTVGAYCIRPPNRAARPEWDVPGRAVGPVDHSPGRNPGRRNPGRRNPGRRNPGAHGYPHQQTNGPPGPNGTYPARPGFRPGL